MQKQLAYMLGRQQIFLELSDDVEEYDELTEIMSNANLNNNFMALAREVRFVVSILFILLRKQLFMKVYCNMSFQLMKNCSLTVGYYGTQDTRGYI